MRGAIIAITIVIIFLSGLFSCTGKEGPIGPQGEPGPGSRIVYQSTNPIPLDYWEVDIPEITLDDMPLVSVYVALEGYDLWHELPSYFEDYPNFGMFCFFVEGTVGFDQCEDFYYKIVLVQ